MVFSFERYKGAAATQLKSKVKAVEVVNLQQMRFRLHELWPDFMTFYGTLASGVGWLVPTKYTEKVGDKVYDEALFGPFWDLGFLWVSAPRVAVSGLGLIPLFACSGPLEDVQLKS